MKKFNNWLKENHSEFFNEVSPDLLNRAADAASLRGDPRGKRMSTAFRAGASRRMEPFDNPRPSEPKKFPTKNFFLDVYFVYAITQMERLQVFVTKIEPVKNKMDDLEVVKLEGRVVEGYGYVPDMGDHEGERPEVEILVDLSKKPFGIMWGDKRPDSGLQHKRPMLGKNLYISREGATRLASQLTDLRSYYVGEDDVFMPYRATDFQLAR